jgi:hypothetical protein
MDPNEPRPKTEFQKVVEFIESQRAACHVDEIGGFDRAHKVLLDLGRKLALPEVPPAPNVIDVPAVECEACGAKVSGFESGHGDEIIHNRICPNFGTGRLTPAPPEVPESNKRK